MIQFLTGDTRDILKTLPDKSVSTIITSPPYNIGVKYDVWDDQMDSLAYDMFLHAVSLELHRVLTDDGSFFLQVGAKPSEPLRHLEILGSFLRIGDPRRPSWTVQNDITWVKSISIGEDTVGHFKTVNSDRYLNNTNEHIFHLTKTGKVALDRVAAGVPYKDKSNIDRFKGIKQDKRCRGNTWFIPYPTVHGAKAHPASFPIDLPRLCIQLAGSKGTILDPFAGSGTTLKAAEQLGLDAIGIDISEAYKALWEGR
jgi:site-specific DNA-methyltransferase (adenine-specific)